MSIYSREELIEFAEKCLGRASGADEAIFGEAYSPGRSYLIEGAVGDTHNPTSYVVAGVTMAQSVSEDGTEMTLGLIGLYERGRMGRPPMPGPESGQLLFARSLDGDEVLVVRFDEDNCLVNAGETLAVDARMPMEMSLLWGGAMMGERMRRSGLVVPRPPMEEFADE